MTSAKTAVRRMPAYPLRLPASIKREGERLAAEDGTSFNQFVASAVAEKIGALRSASYFADRRAKADWEAFDRLMARPGGAAPQKGDEVPGDLAEKLKLKIQAHSQGAVDR
jgi:hypothetical protein